jgi:hypothetical protein
VAVVTGLKIATGLNPVDFLLSNFTNYKGFLLEFFHMADECVNTKL